MSELNAHTMTFWDTYIKLVNTGETLLFSGNKFFGIGSYEANFCKRFPSF
jgi:hypothetical protein